MGYPSRSGLVQFHRAAVEGVITSALSVWFGSMSAEYRRQLDIEVFTVSRSAGFYKVRLQKKVLKFLKVPLTRI